MGNKVTLGCAPACGLERACRAALQGEACRQSPAHLLSRGDRNKSPGRPRWLELSLTEYLKVESYPEREPETTYPTRNIQLNTDQHLHVSKLPEEGKAKHLGEWKVVVPGASTELERGPLPPKSDLKNLRIPGAEYSEKSCITCGE